jgi:RNA polymerase sigma-70 factor (ECF subfamily)
VRNRARDARPAGPLPCEDGLPPAAGAGPEIVVERKQANELWSGLLAALPARYRAPVVLRCVEGLSYAEAAEALGRPVGTVKAQVHRGLALLRAALAELEEREGAR